MVWRVAAGTAVYIFLVVLAAPFPHAAGLMLTFPALNGLAFFFAEQASIGPMARSMLWLPVINGSLCAAFMIVFLSLLGDVNETVLAGSLAVAVVGAWISIAFRPQVIAGIPERRQLAYAIICTLAGLLLVGLAHVLLPEVHFGAADSGIFSWQSVDRTILSSKLKIVLFALALALFLGATAHRRVPDGVRGVLAGLPLVPFADAGLNFVHVDDVARGIVLVLDRGQAGRSYVLGGENARVADAFAALARVTGRALPRLRLPYALLQVGALVRPGLREVVTSTRGVTFWATHARAKSELGYTSRALEAGLRDTYASATA